MIFDIDEIHEGECVFAQVINSVRFFSPHFEDIPVEWVCVGGCVPVCADVVNDKIRNSHMRCMKSYDTFE